MYAYSILDVQAQGNVADEYSRGLRDLCQAHQWYHFLPIGTIKRHALSYLEGNAPRRISTSCFRFNIPQGTYAFRSFDS